MCWCTCWRSISNARPTGVDALSLRKMRSPRTRVSLAYARLRRPPRNGLGGSSPSAGSTKNSPMWVERAGDLFEDADGRVHPPPLQPAHVGTVDFGVERQILLRSASHHPQPANIPGDKRLRLHPGRRAACGSRASVWKSVCRSRLPQCGAGHPSRGHGRAIMW
jgi:hypothetical protein